MLVQSRGLDLKHIVYEASGYDAPCVTLGAAAEDADAAGGEAVAEQLSSETELGRGMLRALWRWASFQVPDMQRRTCLPEICQCTLRLTAWTAPKGYTVWSVSLLRCNSSAAR